MRKAGMIIVVLFVMHASTAWVFAGTINPEEARIIDAASGSFHYQGETYRATSDALSQMTVYLNQDGVDLSQTQADRAIQLMFYEQNIKTAIDGGYLVPLPDDGDDPGTSGEGTGTETGGTTGDGTETGTGMTDNGSTGGNTGGTPGDILQGTDPGVLGFVQIMFPEGTIQGFDSQGTLVISGGLPVKNTGYDLSLLLGLALLVGALASGLLVFVKREIRFFVVPLAFVLLFAGIFSTVGASARSLLLADVESAMILGAPEISWLPEGMTQDTGQVPASGTLDAERVGLPAVGSQYGEIRCDGAGLLAPLYFGDTDAIFEKGAGQYVLSGIPGAGRPILVGGHDVSFFAPLEDMKQGDEVTVRTYYGIFVYTVSEIQVESVKDWSRDSLEGDSETLILYTCYPFGSVFGVREDRLYVTCDKTSGPTITDSSVTQ